MYFCLKMKSDYSFLSSTITIDDAISFAKKNNNTYISLIDNNLHCALDFYKLCQSNNIKPIIGVELSIEFDNSFYPLIFIAKSEIGYKNLVRLTSLAYRNSPSYIRIQDLSLYSQDVALVISSNDSFVANCIKNNLIFEANEYIEILKGSFKEILGGIYRYKGADFAYIDEIKSYFQSINISCLAMQIATHKTENDTIILNLLNCIKNSTYASKEYLSNNEIVESYLKNDHDLKIYYEKDELEGLMKFANSIALKLNKIDFSLPIVYKNENQNDKLKEIVFAELKNRNITDNKYIDRANYEIDIITKMGFANYYLIVSDYVNYSKSHHIPVGPARGSGVSSLVAYLLNITSIDPMKYDLLFERFLNPSRSNYPDFDVDFADIYRDQVIEYVKEKYGYQNVCQISTFVTFGPKTAIRDIARLLKTPSADVDYLMSYLPKEINSIAEEMKNNQKLKNVIDIRSNYRMICEFASKIEKLKKQVGIHPAGIILSSSRIDELVPCYKVNDTTLVSQYDKDNNEKIGLIKMDFLGIKNLTIIDYCLKLVNEKYQTNYDINNFSFDYSEAYDVIAKGYNVGIFQLSKDGINNVAKKLKPTNFLDIVALLALYRPGPMDMIDTYIERKNEHKSFTYIEDSIKDILSPTYGIIIYQEQIMQIVQKVANFSLADADILRRAISKKDSNLIKSEKQKFMDGCLSNHFNEEKASELFALIEKFADYGFNKAHSVGYATITVMMAYLKAKHPLMFYQSLLNVNQEHGTNLKKLMVEAKKFNINFLYPSVNESSYTYTIKGNDLLLGLTNIVTIKETIAKIIIHERNIAPFGDIFDFFIRMVKHEVMPQTLLDLTLANALNCFNISKNKIVANIEHLYDFAKLFLSEEYIPNSYKDPKYDISIPLMVFEDNETDYIKKEYELLGMYISKHPLQIIKEKANKKVTDLFDLNEDGLYDVIGKITIIELKKTKDNKPFLNLSLEDDTNLVTIRAYQNANEFYDLLKKGDIVSLNLTKRSNNLYLNKVDKLEDTV